MSLLAPTSDGQTDSVRDQPRAASPLAKTSRSQQVQPAASTSVPAMSASMPAADREGLDQKHMDHAPGALSASLSLSPSDSVADTLFPPLPGEPTALDEKTSLIDQAAQLPDQLSNQMVRETTEERRHRAQIDIAVSTQVQRIVHRDPYWHFLIFGLEPPNLASNAVLVPDELDAPRAKKSRTSASRRGRGRGAGFRTTRETVPAAAAVVPSDEDLMYYIARS